VDAQNERSGSCDGSNESSKASSPPSCSVCPRLVESLTRQSEAMERLADLLPQLVAANMALVASLTDRDQDEPAETYLDGSPVSAKRSARS
jgi:hypothetical protein